MSLYRRGSASNATDFSLTFKVLNYQNLPEDRVWSDNWVTIMQIIQDGMQQLMCSGLHFGTYCATGTSTGWQSYSLLLINDWLIRSWKNHLRSCKPENQVTIYQTLCILIDEHSLNKFESVMDQFIQHWNIKEPGFMEYFKKQYQSRPGEPKWTIFLWNECAFFP